MYNLLEQKVSTINVKNLRALKKNMIIYSLKNILPLFSSSKQCPFLKIHGNLLLTFCF